MIEKIKNLNWGHAVIGAILTVIGLCFLFFHNALVALTIIVGVILCVAGVALGFFSISSPKRDFAFAAKITIASAAFVCGMVTAILNDRAIEILIACICLILVVDGSFKLYTAALSKRYSVGGWWILMVLSVLIIISAFTLAKLAPQSTSASTVWLGITMLADAVANFVSPIWEAKCKTAEHAQIYYEAHRELEKKE